MLIVTLAPRYNRSVHGCSQKQTSWLADLGGGVLHWTWSYFPRVIGYFNSISLIGVGGWTRKPSSYAPGNGSTEVNRWDFLLFNCSISWRIQTPFVSCSVTSRGMEESPPITKMRLFWTHGEVLSTTSLSLCSFSSSSGYTCNNYNIVVMTTTINQSTNQSKFI